MVKSKTVQHTAATVTMQTAFLSPVLTNGMTSACHHTQPIHMHFNTLSLRTVGACGWAALWEKWREHIRKTSICEKVELRVS